MKMTLVGLVNAVTFVGLVNAV